MKWMWLLSATLAFCAGLFLGYYCFRSDPQVRIVETVVYKTQYHTQPSTLEGYKECYEEPITVTAEANGDVITVYATDSCKSVEAEIGIACDGKIKFSTGALIFGAGIASGLIVALVLI